MSTSISDPLAPALLPVVIHELNNATQMLSSLNAVLALPGGADFLTERAADMTSVGDEVLELGWLVAALSSASGSDMLQARRHPEGLDVMARLIRKALRREGRDLTPAEGTLPWIRSQHGRGWEAAWALGLLLWQSGKSTEQTVGWSWTQTDEAWIFEVDQPLEGAGELGETLATGCPGAEFVCESATTQLRLPLAYLELA